MKNKIIIVLLIIFFIGIILASMYVTDRIRMKNNEPVIFSTWGYSYTPPLSANDDTVKNMVIIKNNEISNEELIDEFIEKAVYSNIDNEEIDIIQDGSKIKLKYTSGEYAKTIERYKDKYESDSIPMPTTVPSSDGSYEQNKKIYGYYSVIINDELKGEYPLGSHLIKRTIDDGNITLYVDAPLIEYIEMQTICTYSLESSNYSKKFDLVYRQRKDLGIKNIFDAGEYEIKTFGGDVTITIERDMVYTLEDALSKGIITPNDIIAQVKMDVKYGICQYGLYSDGGSIEYCYYGTPNNQYTILKLNTLEGDKDLIIGMGGQILNSYNKNK